MGFKMYVRSRRQLNSLLSASVCGWLLLINLSGHGLEWHKEQGFRWAALDVPKDGKPGFTLLTAQSTGLVFTNTLDDAAGAANRVLYGGSGLGLGCVHGGGLA